MTNAQLATASLDDIVFDGRNRGYGAYVLRSLYQRHITRALMIAVAMCALLLVFPLVAQWLKEPLPAVAPPVVKANPIIVDMPVTELEKPVVPPAAVKPATQPPQLPTLKNVIPVVAKEEQVTEKDVVPSQDELLNKESGAKTVEGDPKAGLANLENLPVGKDGPPTTEVVESRPYTYVEQMPELPGGGGQLAIVTAIQKAVKYPGLALRNGVEGKMYVSFTVNPKGEVIDVKIVKGLGSGLDEETLRAIKTLPKFIPGKQNGREVSVSFTVPVTYRIQ